jgi:dolichol kinase
MLRKLFHILYFMAIFIALRLTIIAATNIGFFNDPNYTLEANILGITSDILMPPWKWYGRVGLFQLVMAYALLITTYVISWIDMVRKSDFFYMPIKHTMMSLMRPKELCITCSSVEMTMGFAIAALFLPPLPMMAISFIIVFSDTFASQFGMRLGKTKLPWNKAKSVQGTLAGFVVSFGAIMFVGPIWGLVCVFIFVVVDLFTEEPIPLSDNLLYAILGLIFFNFLAFLGVPYTYSPWILGV